MAPFHAVYCRDAAAQEPVRAFLDALDDDAAAGLSLQVRFDAT